MSHSNDNFESRERAIRGQAGEQVRSTGAAAQDADGRDLGRQSGFAEAQQSYYPHPTREFVASGSLYEGGVSAQPPAPDGRSTRQ